MYRTFVLSCVLIFHGIAFGQEAKATRPAITGLSHMTLYADDLNKSREFYSELLGWEQVPSGSAESGVRFYANHVQYIELLSPPSKGLANRFDSIGFSTSDAERLRKFLGANGVAVPPVVTVDRDGNRFFYVEDPEGNKVEFTQEGTHAPKEVKPASARLSTHIIHAGFVAHDRAALDRFYKGLLGFHQYWQGGSSPDHTDWVMMQVPDGTDWVEYMFYLPANPSREQLGGANHFAPGVVSVTGLEQKLKQKGWVPSAQDRPPLLGADGKWQLDIFDRDGTRVEFTEFQPVKKPCCAPFTGPQPSPSPIW
jgi:catechol 2,3-dioxygenase-like lactoylglutathione lyase family enzyme